jgi:hypothetical protein
MSATAQEQKIISPLRPCFSIHKEYIHYEEIEAEGNLSNLDNGGAAMVAYAYLQFANMTDAERELYRQALLRYCELDTMAMVMIWEYWGKEIGRW